MDDRLTQAKALLAQLEALGVAEVQDQITALKAVISDLEAKAVAEAEVVKTEAVAVVADVEAAEQSFCQQHAITVQALNTWAAVLAAVLLIKLL